MIKTEKVLTHSAIKGWIDVPKEMTKTMISIQHKLFVMAEKKPILLDPVSAIIHGGTKLFMERIIGTTHFLSNNRKIIYDVAFADVYIYDGKIPQNHFVVDHMLLKIEDWCHIDEEEKFLNLLNKEIVPGQGMRFFIDDVLYCSNVPFMKAETLRNELLKARNIGDRVYFKVLKVIDPSGNVAEFITKLTPEKIEKRRRAQHGRD
jgi:hypothetical protein